MRTPQARLGRVLSVLVAAVTLGLLPVTATQAAAAPRSFDVLQLNLCNSGFADCYSHGKSVDSALATIQQRHPDAVTLNEICARDITYLTKKTGYIWAFTPEYDAKTGGPYQCTGGRGDYGVGILTSPNHGAVGDKVVRRQYRAQDSSNERRVMLCAPYSDFSACTTHLSAESGQVAAKQCRELAGVAPDYGRETVVGGDFNLTAGGNPDVAGCVPPRWFRQGDGSVQHVLAAPGFAYDRTEILPIEGTDHPGLLVELTR